jgi:tetratricopeptide (TPR) repeat protein
MRSYYGAKSASRRGDAGSRLRQFCTVMALLLAGMPGLKESSAQEPDAAPPGAGVLDLTALLEDPISSDAGFREHVERRHALALEADGPDELAAGAREFAQAGAYTTAIGLMWFGEKMAPETSRAEFRDQMKIWAEAARAADREVDEGDQYFKAGRHPEAIEAYLEAVEVHPYNERAHFRLADAWREIYQHQFESDMSLAPLEIRVRVFQDAYRHYLRALAIDPLFFDAYYGVSELRSLIPENQEFLMRTQPETEKALAFRTEVIPVLAALEAGEESAATFVRLGGALEQIGAWDYAIFAYQTALGLGGAEAETVSRIESIRNERLGSPGR